MKTKKLLTLIIAAVITVVLCVTVVAVLDIGETNDTEKSVSTETKTPESTPVIKIERNEFTGDVYPDAVKSRKVTIDGKEITVNYKYSSTSGGTRSDVYLDTDGNKYHFDTEGNFYGKQAVKDNTVKRENDENKKVLTEKDCIEIAENYMRATFGSEVDDYKYSSHTYQEHNEKYWVDFKRYIGKDDFILVDICTVAVYAKGEVTLCTKSSNDPLEGFDMALLDGVTREDVVTFAEAEVNRIFGDYGLLKLEWSDSVGLWHNGEKHVLTIGCDFVTEKNIPSELVTLYDIDMDFEKSADKNEKSFYVTFEYELGA